MHSKTARAPASTSLYELSGRQYAGPSSVACEAGGCTCTVKEPETVPTQREYLVMG